MDQQLVLHADAGGVIGAIILILLAALVIAAAWKFITKKKGYGGAPQRAEEKEEALEEEELPEEEEAPEEKPEPAPPPPPPTPRPAIRPEVKAPPKPAEKEPAKAVPAPEAKPPLQEAPPAPPRAAPVPEIKPVPRVEEAPPPPRVEKPAVKKPAPKSLKDGLSKTREGFIARINKALFGGKKSVEEVKEEIEEILFTADIGVKTSQRLIQFVEKELSGKELRDPAKVRDALKAEISRMVNLETPEFDFGKAKPYVMMMVGVNGVGKTTTIGKIGARLNEKGLNVVMAAGDTFRAAAAEQLEVWGDRTKIQVIRGQDGGDPAAVIYDAISAAKSKGSDVVIADTAGRLHTKVPLMEELKKVKRVIAKAHEGAPHEILLVVDANTGQNAIAQAQQFNEALGITGIILTKLDGTAKGGVIIGICDELKVPVRFIGIGESVEDLRAFNPVEFTEALFSEG
jgi:fused signal recognition particle receptor